MVAGNEAAFVWKSSGESFVATLDTARDGEDCGERLNRDGWAAEGGLKAEAKSRERSVRT